MALAWLAACTVGPDFIRPPAPADHGYLAPGEQGQAEHSDITDQQREAPGQRISGDWWTLFHSSDLDRVVKQAIAGNGDLAAAQSSLIRAQQQVVAAGGALYPQVDLSAAIDRERVNLTAATGAVTPTPVYNLYQVGPTITYALDLFGGLQRRVEQTGALAEVAGYQLDATYLALTGDVVVQALTIASLRAQIRATEDIIADDRQNLDLVRTAKAAGSTTEVDVLHAESQLANDRTLLPPLRQRLVVARHALAALVGQAPADWSPPDFDLDALQLPQDLPVSLPSALVRQRPDVLAAEAALHSASAAVGVATAAMYPDIALSANLLQEALFPGHLFQVASTAASVGAGVTAPLFHGGTLQAEKASAEADYRTALARYQQTVVRSFTQVADILQALANDADELAAQKRALASAEASLSLTRLSYSVGNVGVLQVLDAERQYQQARLGAVRAQAQRYLDTAQLFLAMGGGWWNWHGEVK
jgi:NodT family efflux transporter outer membrane factor (OMF) lipoprotein